MYNCFVVLGFIAFDIVTGLLKALKNGAFNSSVMREGGFHKLSEIVALGGAGLLEYAQTVFEFGFEVPALKSVAVYLCVMEFISIIENLCEINPELAKIFKPYLDKLK